MSQNKSLEVDPHKYSQLILDKGAKSVQWRKGSLFKKWLWNNWTTTCKKTFFTKINTLFTKINSKSITDLKHKGINLLGDSTGENLDDLKHDNDFLDTIPKAQFMKEIIDILDLTKMKIFCCVKDNVKENGKKSQSLGENTGKRHI